MFCNAWWPRQCVEALRRLADPVLLRRLCSILSPAESMLISGSYQPANGDTLDWTAADGALLDELANLLGPVPEAEDRGPDLPRGGAEVPELDHDDRAAHPHREVDPRHPHDTYAHILVDEAQDVSPMQWRMLRRRGAAPVGQLSGPAQSPDRRPGGIRALSEIIGAAPVHGSE